MNLLLVAAAAADLILLNGRAHTMDPRRPEATALAVEGGRIVAVGWDVEIRRLARAGVTTLDLGGRAVLPGLIDTHTHAFDAARNRTGGSLDLGIPALPWYTANGAYAGFEEKDKGVLAKGALADLIVLDRDPLAIPASELKDVRVLATLVGGTIVHRDPALPWPAPRPAR